MAPPARVKRLRHVFVRFEAAPQLDIASLLGGSIEIEHENRAVAASLPQGVEHVLSPQELRLIAEMPERDWAPVAEIASDEDRRAALEALIEKRLVLTDDGDPRALELERRADRIAAVQWYGFAALYHYMGKWDQVPDRSDSSAPPLDYEQFVQERRGFTGSFGPAPDAFYRVPQTTVTRKLPGGERKGPLYDLLRRRRTSRSFDRRRPMSLETLSTILRYTYGCHGVAPLTDNLTVIRKTSPSGGALHPIEAYPLIVRVEGLDPGLYHYDVRQHALSTLRTLTDTEAEELVDLFTAGQSFYRSAHALFVLVARFYRNFWKYRGHAKAYKVILMDAAHLSQTLYLVCAELGLGAFFTAAISDAQIERALGLDGIEQGVIGISGCGVLRRDADPGELPAQPFTPGDAAP